MIAVLGWERLTSCVDFRKSNFFTKDFIYLIEIKQRTNWRDDVTVTTTKTGTSTDGHRMSNQGVDNKINYP